MRRVAVACAVFAVGVFAGIALLRSGHHGMTQQERAAGAAVALASGGRVIQVTCTTDHCGVVVRPSGAAACQGWIVPRVNSVLGAPRRAALVNC